MDNTIKVALFSLLSSVIGSLMAIFLTPSLQHYFWKYQRKEDLRFAIINDFNKLMAEFITKYTAHHPYGQYRPDDSFFQALHFITPQIKVLFSEETFQIFKKVEEMIGPGLGGKNIDNFIQSRDSLLQSFYQEIRLPKLHRT